MAETTRHERVCFGLGLMLAESYCYDDSLAREFAILLLGVMKTGEEPVRHFPHLKLALAFQMAHLRKKTDVA